MTRGRISAREKGNGTTVPPHCSGLSWRIHRPVFTWTRAGNPPTPKWIISVIIIRLKMNLRAALFHGAIKDNRCWKSLGGTKIKDYFFILDLLQAQLSHCFIPSSTARVRWGLILVWQGSFGTEAFDREWMLFNLGLWNVLELPGHFMST